MTPNERAALSAIASRVRALRFRDASRYVEDMSELARDLQRFVDTSASERADPINSRGRVVIGTIQVERRTIRVERRRRSADRVR